MKTKKLRPYISRSLQEFFPKISKKKCSTLFYLKFSHLFPSLPMDFDRRATQLALVLLKALDQGINQRLGTKGRRTSYGQFEYSNIYIYTYSNSIDGNNNIDGITIYSN